MIFRRSPSSAMDRRNVRDALVRARATIAVLDEALNEPIAPLPTNEALALRPDLDAPTVIRDLERELANVSSEAETLRALLDEEMQANEAWPKRRQIAEREGRRDLAAQAVERADEHLGHAHELARELTALQNLAREYNRVIAELYTR
jgi:hypothetical protein